ncbi:hypothetical protein AAIH46_02460 [Rhizobium sp. 0TCS1.26]
MDFADAMHVCLMEQHETLVTFDRISLANQHVNSASITLAS